MERVSTAQERHIELEGAFNFRDLGGYVGAGGRPLRWRRLYRADGLHRLSAGDLERLAELGLRTVIDLRTPGEVTERGRIRWPGDDLGYVNLPMMDVLPEKSDYDVTWATSEGVATQYESILADGAPAVRQSLQALSDASSYPVVFHCMAGKDRTGILSAVVLGLLGVADDDIVADYALSAAAMERMLSWYRRVQPERAEELEASAASMVHAEPATMERFLSGQRATYGGLDGYAASLGLGDITTTLRALLLEGA